MAIQSYQSSVFGTVPPPTSEPAIQVAESSTLIPVPLDRAVGNLLGQSPPTPASNAWTTPQGMPATPEQLGGDTRADKRSVNDATLNSNAAGLAVEPWPPTTSVGTPGSALAAPPGMLAEDGPGPKSGSDPTVTSQSDSTAPPESALPPAEPKYVPPPLDDSKHPKLNAHQMDTISVLERHRGAINMKTGDMQKHIDDPKTPADLKKALQEVKDDPTLMRLLDTANRGGGARNVDNDLADSDLNAICEWDEIKKYNAAKAEGFTMTYIASDAKDAKSTEPHEITANDAIREMYKYSADLPDHISPGELQVAIEGKWRGKQVPPQLMAAAKYFLKHPDEWKALAVDGKGNGNSEGRVSRGDLLNTIAKKVYMTPDETDTLKTIGDNLDVFFKVTNKQKHGKTVRNMHDHTMLDLDRAKKIAADPHSKPEVKLAAQKLIDDPMLFSMLDNGQKGHNPNRDTYVDDAKIGVDDFEGFMNRLSTKNKTPPPVPASKTQAATETMTPALAAIGAAAAVAIAKTRQEMIDGAAEKPLKKESKGGGGIRGSFLRFMRKLISPILKIASTLEHIASVALAFMSKVPIIGPFAAGLSIAAEGVAGLTEIANAGIKGEDVGEAAKKAGIGLGMAAVGNLLLPGAGRVVAKVAEKTGVKAAFSAASETVGKAVEPAIDTVKSVASRAAAPFARAGEHVAEQVGSAAQTARDSFRQVTYKTGLSTPERDAASAAQKLGEKAAKAESEAEALAARKAKGPWNMEMRTVEEEELHKAQMSSVLNRVLAGKPVELTGLSLDDAALVLSMQNQMRK